MHFIYILQCGDGSYYVGSTQDVKQRVEAHNSGRGPAFTAHRLPVTLTYQEQFETIEQAVERERQLKRWSRAKKEALIQGDLTLLKGLSKSRTSKQNQAHNS